MTGWTLAASLAERIDIRNVLTESSRQIDLMILLLNDDLAYLLSHRVFAERLTLLDALPVVADGFILIVEIEPQHLSCILGCPDGLGIHARHLAQVVDLAGNHQCMLQFLPGMYLELVGDGHV